MPIAGEFPRGAMPGAQPRAKAPPEHNLVQNPVLTRGVQLFTGVRQAHVMPALSEGLQTSIIAGDIRQDPRTRYPLSFAVFFNIVGDGVNPPRQSFVNPPDHNRIVQLRRFHAYSGEGAPALFTFLYYAISNQNVIPTTGIKGGSRLMFGYNMGIAQLFPPTQSYPEEFVRSSRAGVLSDVNTGINGAYFWRAPWFGTNGSTPSEVLENFDDTRGPRIILYPGSAVDFGFGDGSVDVYANWWWDEYPLT